MKLIYVCSPYSDNIEYNTEKAREYSRKIVEEGNIPLAPHLLLPQFMSEENERDLAIQMNIEILNRCDEIAVFGDVVTEGMAIEITHAKEIGMKIRRVSND